MGLFGGHFCGLALDRDTPTLRRRAKTALFAALAVWCLGYLLADVTPLALKLFPIRITVIGVALGLLEVILGTLAGARLYREQTA